jgi:hypothetical protein
VEPLAGVLVRALRAPWLEAGGRLKNAGGSS